MDLGHLPVDGFGLDFRQVRKEDQLAIIYATQLKILDGLAEAKKTQVSDAFMNEARQLTSDVKRLSDIAQVEFDKVGRTS